MGSYTEDSLFDVLKKYHIPVPRYTSYPTVPFWERTPTETEWKKHILSAFHKSVNKGVDLYVHLPFCESLCTYCACNTRITKNHKLELPYLAAILKEWKMYEAILGERPSITDIHLGGGTPTFFSPENLDCFLRDLFANAYLPEHPKFSFEAHPQNTTFRHLQILFRKGFRRISLGIQDFNTDVQKAIHRFQTVENVESVVLSARNMGYSSVNFDLVYGLPFQDLKKLRDTIQTTIKLRPDRIAFYSYAHVPWMRPGQRNYGDNDFAKGEEKMELYSVGRTMLLEQGGYKEIGMDHFALESDPLFKASEKGGLHRNFMGYTEQGNSLLLGLGVSAIGDAGDAFMQNVKNLEVYQDIVEKGSLPISKGHLHNQEDLIIRKHILELSCNFETTIKTDDFSKSQWKQLSLRLNQLQQDELIELQESKMKITPKGKPYLRNVCMAFDLRMQSSVFKQPSFSSSV